MTENKELPKWVIVSQEYLESIAPKIDAIKKEGQAETKRGIEKVEDANNLQIEADYLARILSQPHNPQYWNDEIVNITGSWLANSIVSFDKKSRSALKNPIAG